MIYADLPQAIRIPRRTVALRTTSPPGGTGRYYPRTTTTRTRIDRAYCAHERDLRGFVEPKYSSSPAGDFISVISPRIESEVVADPASSTPTCLYWSWFLSSSSYFNATSTGERLKHLKLQWSPCPHITYPLVTCLFVDYSTSRSSTEIIPPASPPHIVPLSKAEFFLSSILH